MLLRSGNIFGTLPFVILVALGCESDSQRTRDQPGEPPFQRLSTIRLGMDYDSVVDVLGPGVDIGSGVYVLVYDWGELGRATVAFDGTNTVSNVHGWYQDARGLTHDVHLDRPNGTP